MLRRGAAGTSRAQLTVSHLIRIAILVLVSGLLACGPSARRPATSAPRIAARPAESADALSDVPGRYPTAREQRAIDELERVAEQVRALRFVRPVPFRIQTREVITQFVREKIDAEALERARFVYVALGLIEPDLDVEQLLVGVLGEQIVGYYDPEGGLMVVREDVVAQLGGRSRRHRDLDEAEMVIVHELVHALQDQRLGLGRGYDEERDTDADNAFASLVEGDATLAMFGHMAERSGQPLLRLTRNIGALRSIVRSSPLNGQGQELERAPPIVRQPLLSRYVDGMVFCATLHGQRGWTGVDAAHRSPPRSTEQVLHPERYLAGDEPVSIVIPAIPSLEDAGWSAHGEDTLGELEMGIYFGLASSEERDVSAAQGWGGDRLRVYRSASDQAAVVWFTVWDTLAEAQEAHASAAAVARLATDGLAHVERSGRALLILRGLPTSEQGAVRTAFREFAAPYDP